MRAGKASSDTPRSNVRTTPASLSPSSSSPRYGLVVVVVAVRMIEEHAVSVQGRAYVQLAYWVAEHLGASSRCPRHPFPDLMAGVNPATQLASLHDHADEPSEALKRRQT